MQVVRRAPQHFGQRASRWTLGRLLASCEWLRLKSLAGLWQLLERVGLRWKGSRQHVHSPDPNYLAKQAEIARLVSEVESSDGQSLLFYLDEVTIYRQPTLAHAWEEKGQSQAKAERSHQSDTTTRIVAALNHQSGQVTYLRSSKIGLTQLVEFYQTLRATYPQAKRLYLVQDNWPVHFHPDLLIALENQATPFALKVPPNWPTKASGLAAKKWGELKLPLQIVVLPTYASWLNPIEKLWRYLKQEVVHLHPLANDLAKLRSELDHFLDRFALGSKLLLRYVGLFTD